MSELNAPAGTPFFHYDNSQLMAESVSIAELAERYGTPLYVYSRAALKAAWESYAQPLTNRNALVCFGMKANSNLAVLQQFAQWGSGFDIVSGGELARALKAGAQADTIVFSGVGKQDWEIKAALQAGVKCFNVESTDELERISSIASQLGCVAPVSLRVNPDVDAKTHPYISTGLKDNKFGIAIEIAAQVYQRAAVLPGIRIVGVDCHIGSQITQIEPYLDALERLLNLLDTLAGIDIALEHLDIGGGLGIRYQDETPIAPAMLLDEVFAMLQARGYGHLQLIMEPGRSLVGNAGILVTRVQYLKHHQSKNFAIVDAAMNDLLRPTLYDAWHGVLPAVSRSGHSSEAQPRVYDIVGPICESGDWLARDRELQLSQNDLLVIESAGAYGFVMSCQYNSRPRCAEVMVDGDQSYLIRPRETVEELFASEQMLPG
ncbi:diaminopimelate decarboxylase [Advenella sp. S44]|uniref:diaminopimelate decarboxylase n=1 Tax=Advenella sp. S44 TaxID=1982755 RepID=UPI000C2ADC11|nr:diaminopimelate decarboxylase [Advenella sp. S44]PJX27704.1 diaminopimelate decarboxylase [Advenella sp. S44]